MTEDTMGDVASVLTVVNALLFVLYVAKRPGKLLRTFYLHEALVLWAYLYAVGATFVRWTTPQLDNPEFALIVQTTLFSLLVSCFVIRILQPRVFHEPFLGESFLNKA